MKHKNLITIVTDHRLTADTIAEAIGAGETHEGYYLGNGYAVTWTNGRLIEAEFSPLESFVLSTSMNPRLLYAHNFKFAMRDYDGLVGYNKSAEDAVQLSTVKALWNMSRVIVNAMRPDISGDLDFLSLYYFLGSPVEVRRAWLPMLTKKAIIHSVNHGPQNRKEYEKWLEESICNHIVEQIENHSYETVPVTMEKPEKDGAAVPDESGTMSGVLPDSGGATVCAGHIRILTEHTPLFNLSSLVAEAAEKLGYEQEKTAGTAIILYCKKLISYPVTIQNSVPTGVWRSMACGIKSSGYDSKRGRPCGTPSRRHNFKGESLYDGFGIVTTGLRPTDLTRDEERLYDLISRRVKNAFATDRTARKHRPKKRIKYRRRSGMDGKNA